MRTTIKRTVGERIIFSIVFVILAIYALFILYHFYFLLQLATKSFLDFDNAILYNTYGTWSKGENFQLSNLYESINYFKVNVIRNYMPETVSFLELTFNSIWFAIGSEVIVLLIQSGAAYVICKYEFKGKSFLYNLVIVRMMIPIVGTLPSAYKAYKMIGLIDSPLILLTATDVLGGANFLIVYAFYKGISWDYAEAAFIDGASHFQVYFKIMLQMALPAISVLFITGFIGRWNEYLNISIFMPNLPTLSYGLYKFQADMLHDGARMPIYFSGVFLAAIPCITLFIIFQNSIMQTVHFGGIKG